MAKKKSKLSILKITLISTVLGVLVYVGLSLITGTGPLTTLLGDSPLVARTIEDENANFIVTQNDRQRQTGEATVENKRTKERVTVKDVGNAIISNDDGTAKPATKETLTTIQTTDADIATKNNAVSLGQACGSGTYSDPVNKTGWKFSDLNTYVGECAGGKGLCDGGTCKPKAPVRNYSVPTGQYSCKTLGSSVKPGTWVATGSELTNADGEKVKGTRACIKCTGTSKDGWSYDTKTTYDCKDLIADGQPVVLPPSATQAYTGFPDKVDGQTLGPCFTKGGVFQLPFGQKDEETGNYCSLGGKLQPQAIFTDDMNKACATKDENFVFDLASNRCGLSNETKETTKQVESPYAAADPNDRSTGITCKQQAEAINKSGSNAWVECVTKVIDGKKVETVHTDFCPKFEVYNSEKKCIPDPNKKEESKTPPNTASLTGSNNVECGPGYKRNDLGGCDLVFDTANNKKREDAKKACDGTIDPQTGFCIEKVEPTNTNTYTNTESDAEAKADCERTLSGNSYKCIQVQKGVYAKVRNTSEPVTTTTLTYDSNQGCLDAKNGDNSKQCSAVRNEATGKTEYILSDKEPLVPTNFGSNSNSPETKYDPSIYKETGGTYASTVEECGELGGIYNASKGYFKCYESEEEKNATEEFKNSLSQDDQAITDSLPTKLKPGDKCTKFIFGLLGTCRTQCPGGKSTTGYSKEGFTIDVCAELENPTISSFNPNLYQESGGTRANSSDECGEFGGTFVAARGDYDCHQSQAEKDAADAFENSQAEDDKQTENKTETENVTSSKSIGDSCSNFIGWNTCDECPGEFSELNTGGYMCGSPREVEKIVNSNYVELPIYDYNYDVTGKRIIGKNELCEIGETLKTQGTTRYCYKPEPKPENTHVTASVAETPSTALTTIGSMGTGAVIGATVGGVVCGGVALVGTFTAPWAPAAALACAQWGAGIGAGIGGVAGYIDSTNNNSEIPRVIDPLYNCPQRNQVYDPVTGETTCGESPIDSDKEYDFTPYDGSGNDINQEPSLIIKTEGVYSYTKEHRYVNGKRIIGKNDNCEDYETRDASHGSSEYCLAPN